ncbi:MAG: hypothetical protein HQ582_09900 [Planctomycetes bacterium]|nr:hypothetical protein [Planctomycetota bacterium]
MSAVFVWVGSLSAPGCLSRVRAGEEKRAGDDRTEDEGEKRLDGMRRRAQATQVHTLDAGEKTALELFSGPMFRYSDQPRLILDATLWGWGTRGRPLAMEKIEFCRRPQGQRQWFHCMTSLSQDLLEVQWPDGQRWSAREPAFELHALADGPNAAESEFRRLLQMKSTARRFSATLFEPVPKREDLRLLTRPICRYTDPDSGLQDVAIFGFVANGTNPDLLLGIELHGESLSDSAWKFGLARMTLAQLTVRLDGKEVWSARYVTPPPPGVPAKFDTWLFFFESARPKTGTSR